MFTYNYGANPPIDYPRMLISDTVETQDGQRVYAFEDSEILAMTQIELSTYQSSQYYNAPLGNTLPSNPPMPWRRIAASLLDSLAANQARIILITKVLDVTLNPRAASEMRAQAAALREVDDNAGAIMIIEQVNNVFSFRDRYFKSVQRQSGGGVNL